MIHQYFLSKKKEKSPCDFSMVIAFPGISRLPDLNYVWMNHDLAAGQIECAPEVKVQYTQSLKKSKRGECT